MSINNRYECSFNLYTSYMGLDINDELALMRRFDGKGRVYIDPITGEVAFEFETTAYIDSKNNSYWDYVDDPGYYSTIEGFEKVLVDRNDPFQAPSISEVEFYLYGTEKPMTVYGKNKILAVLEVLLKVAEKSV